MRVNVRKKILLSFLLAGISVFTTACVDGDGTEYGRMIDRMRAGKAPREAAEQRQVQEGGSLENAAGEPPAPCRMNGAQFWFRAGQTYLEVYNGTEFEDIYIKGVNMGLGKPGYFPGETAVTRDEYAGWFRQIGEMHANCVRVYTVQPPGFYEALYEYNLTADRPLYLFQGTWYDEGRLAESGDAFDETMMRYLEKDMRDLVDLIHGNATIEPVRGKASGTYRYDISPYVAGWILGIESDAAFVTMTNEAHPELTAYEGTYICADDATPFEVFWAQTGDYIVSYEMEKYRTQRPVSYSNWITADMLTHPSETMEQEDSITLNQERLRATEAFPGGMFASYHIYPYYPNLLYTQTEYREYRDADGNPNPYRAYLEDLIAQHTMPVLVAEFGIPVSRGITHANPITGFDQGHHTEEEQGQMLASMMQDIHDSGYAGGLVFAWQDEWFKRTWNTEDYSNPDRRAYWCDMMTCEQHFGLLDFVPGNGRESVILDGDDTEWGRNDVLLETGTASLSARYDCAYLYLMVKKNTGNFDGSRVVIPFDITPYSGSRVYEGMTFSRPADFVLVIDGKEDSRLLVHSYYDRYQYYYAKYEEQIRTTEEVNEIDNALFVPIYSFLERELILPDREEVIPVQRFEAGALRYGTNDFASAAYDSLADFYYEGGVLEIRIPWLLLNFRDPSRKEIEDDFRRNDGFSGIYIDGIWVGLAQNGRTAELAHYTWDDWDQYPYFERLRKSYYILQKQFAGLDVMCRNLGCHSF